VTPIRRVERERLADRDRGRGRPGLDLERRRRRAGANVAHAGKRSLWSASFSTHGSDILTIDVGGEGKIWSATTHRGIRNITAPRDDRGAEPQPPEGRHVQH
jgi:hypothetical protein